MVEQRRLHLDSSQSWILAIVCLCAGIAALAGRWLTSDASTRVIYGLVVTAVYLAVALSARAMPSLRPYWELAFAFFILAFVQVLNSFIPIYAGTSILHDPPSVGDPLASTVSGTVAIQLLETLLAIVPVVAFTLASGGSLESIYLRPGKLGGWLAFAVAFFVLFFAFVATLPLRPDSPAHQLLPGKCRPDLRPLSHPDTGAPRRGVLEWPRGGDPLPRTVSPGSTALSSASAWRTSYRRSCSPSRTWG